MTMTEETQTLTPSTPDTRTGVPNDNARPGARNDNGREDGARDTTALVAHPDFVKTVRWTLIRHGRRRHLQDEIPEIQMLTLAAAREGLMPVNLAQWRTLGHTIATSYAINEYKKRKARRKYDAGLCEEPDEHGPLERPHARDPVDTSRYLAILGGLFERGEMPDMGGEILWGVAEKITPEEMHEDTGGLSPRTAKYRLKQMRGRFASACSAHKVRPISK